jgi:hypothetical protein
MRDRRGIVLKAFLTQCPPEKRDLLCSLLSESEKTALSHLPDISLSAPLPELSFLDSIHWSWLVPILEKYSRKEQKMLIKTLPINTQKALHKALQLTDSSENISSIGTSFLRQVLTNALHPEPLLPIHLLPPSPLNLLIEIEKKKLIQLIDLLSLYDLASELRQIVETKILQKIYSFLSEDEKLFLKIARGHKEPYPPAHIRLDQWDGSKQTLRLTLHRIGLARLGSALSGQDADLIWYVCHRLDVGRGKTLEKLCSQETMPGIAQWLIEQMKELL